MEISSKREKENKRSAYLGAAHLGRASLRRVLGVEKRSKENFLIKIPE